LYGRGRRNHFDAAGHTNPGWTRSSESTILLDRARTKPATRSLFYRTFDDTGMMPTAWFCPYLCESHTLPTTFMGTTYCTLIALRRRLCPPRNISEPAESCLHITTVASVCTIITRHRESADLKLHTRARCNSRDARTCEHSSMGDSLRGNCSTVASPTTAAMMHRRAGGF
jgi:hypothetical protein